MLKKLNVDEFMYMVHRDMDNKALRNQKYKDRITGSVMARGIQIENCIATKKALGRLDNRRVNCGRC